MEKLIRGIHEFQTTHFNEHQEFFAQLSKGQQPETLLITCSDSRVEPDLLKQTQLGELFVIRNAGNIVPPYGAANGGEGASIEFAVSDLRASHIVIMGHSHCGAMKGLLKPESLASLPLVSDWLKHAEATRRVVMENYQDFSGEDLLNATIKENVLMQLDNIRTYPAVAVGLVKGTLTLHAWVHHIESGQILAYNPEQSRFMPITSTQINPAVANKMSAAPAQVLLGNAAA